MSNESFNPDIEIGDMRYDIDDANKDNIENIRRILDKIAIILTDIDNRLKGLGG